MFHTKTTKMTPKEKAKELVKKYGFCLRDDDKKAALIAVDEIINLLFGKDLNGTIPESITDYWYEVKSEIEQL